MNVEPPTTPRRRPTEAEKYRKRHDLNKKRALAYYYEKRTECLAQKKEYLAKNPSAMLACYYRTSLQWAVRPDCRKSKIANILDCTLEQLRDHLTDLFEPGMTWGNYPKVWRVGFVRPPSKFDLTDVDQLKQCFCRANLKPVMKER